MQAVRINSRAFAYCLTSYRNAADRHYNMESIKPCTLHGVSRFISDVNSSKTNSPPVIEDERPRTVAYQPKEAPPFPIPIPSKEKMIKMFFRGVAVLYDITVWAYAYMRFLYWRHIQQNPKVQDYWRTFLTKMEQSRKEEPKKK